MAFRRIGFVLASLILLWPAGLASTGSDRGRAGIMPAFYDDQLFTINFAKLSSEDTLLAHNRSLNVIYMSDECMPGGHMFVAVIDAIQGDGFNPLWQEVQIAFDNPDFPCQQLTGDEDILDAAASSLITLEPTTEVYRCSVVGSGR